MAAPACCCSMIIDYDYDYDYYIIINKYIDKYFNNNINIISYNCYYSVTTTVTK